MQARWEERFTGEGEGFRLKQQGSWLEGSSRVCWLGTKVGHFRLGRAGGNGSNAD
jgi:hypothetical protein